MFPTPLSVPLAFMKFDLVSFTWSNFIKARGTDKGVGNTVELMGRLHLDFAFQGRALIGGVPLRIKLIPTKPEFSLTVTATEIKPVITVENATIYVRRAKVTNQVLRAHNEVLAIRPAKYPSTRAEVKRSILKQNTIDAIVENLVTGRLPRRIFIAFVSNEAANGSFSKNPYNFKLFNINFLSCYVNGHPYPTIPFQPNVSKNHTLREYYSLMDAANQTGTSTYLDIDRDDFNNGYGIFGINLSPDLSDGCGMTGHIGPIKEGSLRVQVIFKSPLPETVTMLTYCEFDSIFQIDANRNPIVDQL